MSAVLPGIHLIETGPPFGGNVWLLLKGRDAALIDTGVRWDRRRVLTALAAALPPDARLHSILLTHGHCDHAGSAAFLAQRFGARLCAHAREVPFIATRHTYAPRGLRALGAQGFLFAAGEAVFPVRRHAVDVVLTGSDTVETPIGPLIVVQTPGHTPGHASYFHAREGWLFSGDALLNIVPFARRTALSLPPAIFSADMPEVRRSARRIAELGPSALLPGHGWPHLDATAAAVRAFAAALPP